MKQDKLYLLMETVEDNKIFVNSIPMEKDHDFLINILNYNKYINVSVADNEHNFHFFKSKQEAIDYLEHLSLAGDEKVFFTSN